MSMEWVLLLVTTLLGVVGSLGGVVLYGLKQQNEALKAELAELRQRVTDQCVRRDDYVLMRTEMLDRLKDIDAKLDKLSDRLGSLPGGA
uniref:Uncharacterized protein n=1 Tax=Nitratidesulfovibrio vulgaris (strain DSM 19637 / Miyazaki F) TaxID=883 RepID=B8DKX9_NITV9